VRVGSFGTGVSGEGNLGITTVRLDLEENQLLIVAGKIGLKAGSCKAHEIWVFSKTETDRICRQSVERCVELEFLLDDGDDDITASSLRSC
jgi:hypothetical protein